VRVRATRRLPRPRPAPSRAESRATIIAGTAITRGKATFKAPYKAELSGLQVAPCMLWP
jgi:hypothetical protein